MYSNFIYSPELSFVNGILVFAFAIHNSEAKNNVCTKINRIPNEVHQMKANRQPETSSYSVMESNAT